MKKGLVWATALLALPSLAAGQGQKMPPLPPPTPPAVAPAPASNAPKKLSLDEAIRLALQHNHALQAARTTILQNQAEEVTANLRPNPNLSWDSQFFPLFNPGQFSASYLENQAQFDVGISYLIERGKKRQHRLQAAKDQTAVSRSTVTDNERTLVFNTSQQFNAAALDQFGNALTNQPAMTWSATGGAINSTGLFTAPVSAGTFTITATTGTVSGTATAAVVNSASIASTVSSGGTSAALSVAGLSSLTALFTFTLWLIFFRT